MGRHGRFDRTLDLQALSQPAWSFLVFGCDHPHHKLSNLSLNLLLAKRGTRCVRIGTLASMSSSTCGSYSHQGCRAPRANPKCFAFFVKTWRPEKVTFQCVFCGVPCYIVFLLALSPGLVKRACVFTEAVLAADMSRRSKVRSPGLACSWLEATGILCPDLVVQYNVSPRQLRMVHVAAELLIDPPFHLHCNATPTCNSNLLLCGCG